MLPPDDGIVDDIAITRRMAGDRTIRLTATERVELVRRWIAAGNAPGSCERATGIRANRYLHTDYLKGNRP